MKKLVIILVLLVSIVSLTACNKEIGLDNYRFDKAVVYFAGEKTEYEIKGWRDYEGDQIQITLKDGTVILAHSNNVLLIKTK